MECQLRKAVLADLPRIQALFAEMIAAVDPGHPAAGYAPEDVGYYFNDGEDWICIAESEGEVIGFLAMEVHREDVNYIYLDDLSVSAAHRGNGIGTALLQEADRLACRIGFELIVLHVKITNPRAKKLYEKMGFVVLDDDGDRYRMLKRI